MKRRSEQMCEGDHKEGESERERRKTEGGRR